jgi:hypothetical protein
LRLSATTLLIGSFFFAIRRQSSPAEAMAARTVSRPLSVTAQSEAALQLRTARAAEAAYFVGAGLASQRQRVMEAISRSCRRGLV